MKKKNVYTASYDAGLKVLSYDGILDKIRKDYNPSNSPISEYRFSAPVLLDIKGRKVILILIECRKTGFIEIAKSLKNREGILKKISLSPEDSKFKPIAWAEITFNNHKNYINYLSVLDVVQKYGIPLESDDIFLGREVKDATDQSELMVLEHSSRDLTNYFIKNKKIRSDYKNHIEKLDSIYSKYKYKLYSKLGQALN